MRYLDQIFEVNVPVPDLTQDDSAILEQLSANLHRRYQELYSYQQSDQEVRLVTLRASVFGALDPVDLPKSEGKGRLEDALKGKRSVYLSGVGRCPGLRYGQAARFVGDGGAGDRGVGLYYDFASNRGYRAVADGYGGMRMQVAIEEDEVETDMGKGVKPDPITVAVVESRLNTIALEMAEVMIRTSMSQILNSSRDFSTAIIDADCQLVAQGEGIPVHISALPLAAAAVKQYFGDRIYDGDMFALNDPYFGGSHIPDITVIQPIFYEGKLRFFAVNRAHHSDVGGATHGGYNPSASEIYQEGIRIPPLKLIERGVARDDVLHMLSANVRHPENFLGDFQAQFGSVRIAARRIIAMLERYGAEGLSRAVDEILHGTEVQVREMISNWPDGVYKGESFIDDDGFDAKMVPIRATVTIAGDSMTIDLSESSKQVTGFINSAYANTRSLSHVSLMYMAPFRRGEERGVDETHHRDRAEGADRESVPAGPGDDEHQPLRRRDSRGGLPGHGKCRARRGDRRILPPLEVRDNRRGPQDRQEVHLALLPRARGRWGIRWVRRVVERRGDQRSGGHQEPQRGGYRGAVSLLHTPLRTAARFRGRWAVEGWSRERGGACL